MVFKISSVGTAGKHPGNAERDFHTLINSFCKRLGATIETVQVRMFDHREAKVVQQTLPVIFPDTMAAALFRMGPKVWRKCLFGDLSFEDTAAFWQHCDQRCDYFQTHPGRQFPKWSHLVPFSLYGDDIAVYKNTEVSGISVIAWSSDLSWGGSAFQRYFPICVYSENNACDETYGDLMSQLVPRLNMMFDQAHLHDWSGEGYHFMMSSIQGDLKWIAEKYKLHNFKKNTFCSLCGWCKVHEDIGMTLPDFRDTASYIGSPPDLTDFLQNRSPVFDIVGTSIQRVMHDTAHGQLLGTGKLVNGSALILLCEDGYFGDFGTRGKYKDILQELLREAHRRFLVWKRQHKIQCSQPRFTASRLSRGHRMSYPTLCCNRRQWHPR